MADWDLLIRRGLVFDGHGGSPRTEDVAVAGGRVVARGLALPEDRASRVVDAAGCWVLPGLVDVHTHFDLEVELDPALPEAVRHGTTTVVMGNCSLGIAFGNQRHLGADPIVDCFARVENVPKALLSRVADRATWRDPAGYLAHLDELPLGPNVVPLLPHSMLRVEVMGLEGAITRDPTPAEVATMRAIVGDALAKGYAGLSTDMLPFHYLSNDPNRRRKIPTQYARFGELRALLDEVRRHGRVWQTTPPKDTPLAAFRNFLLSSGRLFGRRLKVTAVAAMDVVPNRMLLPMAKAVAKLLRLLDGEVWFQALPARFKVWAEGPYTPIAEEIPVLRELNELDLDDVAGRRRLLDDPAWQARFRDWWNAPRRPFTKAWLRRLLRYEDTQFTRDLAGMTVDRCPIPSWSGLTFADLHARVLRFQRTGEAAPDEREVLASFPHDVDEAGLIVHLLRTFDTAFSWWVVPANPDEASVERVLLDETFLPGFSDSGAHLVNMAFYDVNLRALRIAKRRGDDAVARMVRRLTRDPCRLFGVDRGTLDLGAVADLVVVDPVALEAHDGEASVRRIHREALGHEQLVNRSDGVVRLVTVGGRVAWENDAPSADLGRETLGACLRASA